MSASEEVNYGRGSRMLSTEKEGTDLIGTFEGAGSGLTPDHFAGRMPGKTSAGKLLFGWSRLPGVDYMVPALAALSPKFEFTGEGLEAYVEVQDFGQVASTRSAIKVMLAGKGGKDDLLAEGTVRPLKPTEKSVVRLVCKKRLRPGSKQTVTLLLESGRLPTESFAKTVTLH